MKFIACFLLTLGCGCYAHAQTWSLSAGGGSTSYKQINKDLNTTEITKARGWNTEIGLRYQTKGRWSYSAALNSGEYKTSRWDEVNAVICLADGYTGGVYAKTTVQTYSLRFSTDYEVLRPSKSKNGLLGKLKFTVGGSMAPSIYRQKERMIFEGNHGNAEWSKPKTSASFTMLVGIQEQLSYTLNARWSVNLSSITQFDPGRAFTKASSFKPDFRASLLLGSSFSIP